MIRILVTGSRMWFDVPLLTTSLDTAAAGHDHLTLIHGRCDPRNAGGDRIPWDEAVADPALGAEAIDVARTERKAGDDE